MVDSGVRNMRLLCTVHRENGSCNADNLFSMLTAIDPDVIFEEIRPEEFDAYYKLHTKKMLETEAVQRFLELKPVPHLPVDDFDSSEELFTEVNDLFAFVEENSEDYLDMSEQRSLLAYSQGFAYLNSSRCADLTKTIREIFEGTVVASGDPGLGRILEKWNSMNAKREEAMLRNIHRYSRNNEFRRGVVLVGAAHRETFMGTVERHPAQSGIELTWSWDGGLAG